MKWRTLAALWNRIFFKPQSPAPLGLYRIVFGLLVMAKVALLYPDWLAWYGEHAWVTLDTMHRLEGGTRIDLFDQLPQSDAWIWAFYFGALVAAFSLALGFLTRISTVLVFFALVSIDERELYAMNSGDTFLRVTAFFMIFAPAGAAFSIDRLIGVWRGAETPHQRPRIIWAQRLIQFQTALVYFVTAWWKSTGTTWVDGTALYYVHHLEQFRRFPVPSWMLGPAMIKVQTWAGLAEEFALGTLVWIREARYWVLAAGVLLHLTLEYTMNVPLFQWVMMSNFVLFIDFKDLARFWNGVCRKIRPCLGSEVEVVYNQLDLSVVRRMRVLRALDIFRKIKLVGEESGKWFVRTGPTNLAGLAGTREIARVTPALWPLLLFLPSNSNKKSAVKQEIAK